MLFLIFGSIGGVIFVCWWMFAVSKWFQAWEDEPIIRYTIDVPKPVGDGTALETPSIKVGSPAVLILIGTWFNSNTVLCSGNWRISWIRESCNP
jgi:hypothetical protein